ncbi:MAG: thymidylate synthase, partial [Fusobacteriia bacterium 4572_132]
MKTVAKEAEIKFEERKSKYIGYIKPVNTKKGAEKFIKKIKEKHLDATHNVSAYKVIENEREYFKFSDDGEPQNTAGKPIAELINLMEVNNLVIVVTRYFGGIKLGAGGLIRSYVKAGKLAIIESGIIEYKEKIEFMIEFEYNL